MHCWNDEDANDGMANWRVWDKKRCSLNKIGQVKKWLSYQLALRDRRHTDCVLS
ncbi:hypothetical protein HMPREF1991_01956 [Hoylesella loescheii DSM 19665 = JCM 12249 = ATCC 15930]|uniref:Uncharacterized protein n=1 Tax=Hoylesella loescheii DSM 19665 = JCM 12249 = ATCC 15930 TaxID=1122985 RepID=A0A069QIU8_HOYLO|nr:hypothetical protein HMPREF1991_01956 [Hoylesella loescheii DSM 19665 = JCM 12249 = ATCC 15930]